MFESKIFEAALSIHSGNEPEFFDYVLVCMFWKALGFSTHLKPLFYKVILQASSALSLRKYLLLNNCRLPPKTRELII